MLNQKSILFIGAGSMAEAMVSGIIRKGNMKPTQITVTNRNNKHRLQYLTDKYRINSCPSEKIIINQYDMIVLAMKPKDVENVLFTIKDSTFSHQIIFSVLAGITTSFIESILPEGQQVVRVMPNTASMIGESATAISPGKFTTKQSITTAKELLYSIGDVFEIAEDKMDIFTGLAGSGPAYVYYLIEHMEKTGVNNGLAQPTTRQAIVQTLLGAAKMLQQQDVAPSDLREQVTSPNGTTSAGLAALDRYGGGKAISEAIKEAAARSKDMSLLLCNPHAEKAGLNS